jgi:hypothetical protein
MWTDWEKKVDPNRKLPDSLFWDIDLKTFDFQKGKNTVVERVIERGSFDDFYTIFRLYGGIENVREIIKEIHHLSPRDTAFVCVVFDIKKEELRCFTHRRLQMTPWVY